MNTYALAAAVLTGLVAIVHSGLGEWLIFRHLRSGGLVPTKPVPGLHEQHLRILWASWHVLTALGLAIAAVLLHMAVSADYKNLASFAAQSFAIAMLASAALVFVGTRARHPAWLGLSVVALLLWLANV
jgi:hypothetical protein